jgi:hypothetical protein
MLYCISWSQLLYSHRHNGIFKSTSWLHMHLLLSGFGWHLHLKVHPLSISCTALALVQSFLAMSLFRHATLAQRIIFLQATINLIRDSQLVLTLPFGFWRRPMARFWPDSSPYTALLVLRPASLVTYPLVNSWCSPTDCIIPGLG